MENKLKDTSDITSKKFGKLLVLKFVGRNKSYDSLWKCLCDCGSEKIVRGGVLKNGHTQSCGCLHKERTSKAKTKHGLMKDNYKLYKVWIGIKQRCNNTKSTSYKYYGGRGIKICKDWETDFKSFHKWAISNGYKEGLTIERKEVNKNYEPTNCSWILKKFQSENRTSSVVISFNGEEKTAIEWSKIIDIPSNVLTQRIRRGWSAEKTLTTKI